MQRKLRRPVVIVDDNPDDVLLATRFIKKHQVNHEILFFDEGKLLIDYLLNNTNPLPQVVLLDMHMPKLDGLAVLQQLSKIERAQTVPIIMLTSSRYERDITESYRLALVIWLNRWMSISF